MYMIILACKVVYVSVPIHNNNCTSGLSYILHVNHYAYTTMKHALMNVLN